MSIKLVLGSNEIMTGNIFKICNKFIEIITESYRKQCLNAFFSKLCHKLASCGFDAYLLKISRNVQGDFPFVLDRDSQCLSVFILFFFSNKPLINKPKCKSLSQFPVCINISLLFEIHWTK